ncbi:MAG: hypothetical protein KDB97_03840, partial [Flavobacteriales bacterium]|nr:hypothetical protein [Flavobacteriales bacterium]
MTTHRPHDRTMLLFVVGVALAVVASSCSTPRKACRRAQRHIARAVWLCPEALQADTTTRTITVQLPADTITRTFGWSDADVDSILAGCAQLREALQAERDLAVLSGEHKGSGPPVQAIRRAACAFQPFTLENDRVKVTIRQGQDRPLVTLEAKAWHQTMECPPCPPRVAQGPVQVNGPSGRFYRIGFWSLLLLLLLFLAAK